jgi:hypothetical protein
MGVGLHSYGFMESGFFWLTSFILVQFGLIALGLMPVRLWRSLSSPIANMAPQPVRLGARRPTTA